MLGVDVLEFCRDIWGVLFWDIILVVVVCGFGWDDCGELLWDEFVCGEVRGVFDIFDRVLRMIFLRRRLNAVFRILDIFCCLIRFWIFIIIVFGRILSIFFIFVGIFFFFDFNLVFWIWRCLVKKLLMAFLCFVFVIGFFLYWIWRSLYIRLLKYWRVNKL